jgi:hypothetical protein
MSMKEDPGDCGEVMVGQIRPHRKSIGVDRRKELLHLAEQGADWIVAHNIASHELCLFRQFVEALVDTRE